MPARPYAETEPIATHLSGKRTHVLEALPPLVDTPMNAGRGMAKMSAQRCAHLIIRAMERDTDEANIGLVKLLRLVHSISPALARGIMIRF